MTILYLCGAGNPEAVRLALSINRQQGRWERIVLLDDNPATHGRSILGVEVVGPFARLARAAEEAAEVANFVARTTVRRWAACLTLAGYDVPPARLVHPDVDTFGASLGQDLIVYHNANVGPDVAVGDHSVIFMGATVGHGSQLGTCCVVAPHAVLNARVQLGDGAYVGSNATILPEVKVGPWATIGANSVAMTDVPAGATVLGVPGRIVYKLGPKLLEMRAAEALRLAARRELAGRSG